jgi:hypothetical protein
MYKDDEKDDDGEDGRGSGANELVYDDFFLQDNDFGSDADSDGEQVIIIRGDGHFNFCFCLYVNILILLHLLLMQCYLDYVLLFQLTNSIYLFN